MIDDPPSGRGFVIRSANADDASEVDRLYDICLRTAAAGDDATAMFADRRLPGDIFVGPYLRYAPEFAWVLAQANQQPSGYVLGVADTTSFERTLEREWWPPLRGQHSKQPAESNTADASAQAWVADPPVAPTDVTSKYPAHLHIDLLPEAQGGGNGRRLIDTLLRALREHGASGVHLGVGKDNTRAVGFYRHLGFEQLSEDSSTLYLGLELSA